MSVTVALTWCLVWHVSFGFLEQGIPQTGDVNHDTSIQLLVSEVTRLESRLMSAEGNIKSLQAQVVQLTNKNQDVAFYATVSKHQVNPTSGVTVIFDDTRTNSGNHYDPVHGVFTVPLNGTYHFHFVGASPGNSDPNHYMHVYMVKNTSSNRLGYGFFDRNTDYWIQAIISVVAHFNQGDRLWIEIAENSGEHTLAGSKMHTYWSGFLIHAD